MSKPKPMPKDISNDFDYELEDDFEAHLEKWESIYYKIPNFSICYLKLFIFHPFIFCQNLIIFNLFNN